MSMTLQRLMTYPLKGFPGTALAEVDLQIGYGLPQDRRFAITHGLAPEPEQLEQTWVECRHFVRLTINPGLVLFQTRFDSASGNLHLQTEQDPGCTLALNTPDQHPIFNRFLQTRFGSATQNPVRLVERHGGLGYWDLEDAPISILNLASLRALEPYAGNFLHPDRFRANLELDGLPAWEELSWIGQCIEIDGVLLRITAPIERCSAPGINPLNGKADIPVTRLLQQHFGHPYCGVYAKVERAGLIRIGSTIHPPPSLRALVIEQSVTESSDIVSLTLADPLGQNLPPYVAGQHIRLCLPLTDGTRPERSYTLSLAPVPQNQNRYRISIKRKSGISKLLHQLPLGTCIQGSAPRGHFWLQTTPRIPVFICSGVGITPMLAMLHQLAQTDPKRHVHLFFGVRSKDNLPFKDELFALAQNLPNTRFHLFFSRLCPETLPHGMQAHAGRLTLPRLQTLLQFDAYEFYLCGLPAMMRPFSEGLLRLGIPAAHIHIEQFGALLPLPTDHTLPAQANIHFSQSGRSIIWRDPGQTLLDLAEQTGLKPAYDCRAGTCGACRCKVRGKVSYAMPPMLTLAEDEVLICSARPMGDLEIEL